MPKGILLAVMTACLMWGWLTEAAIFGLAWCGLLRIGEALEANRADLILGTAFALLQVRTPKTRGRAARHQAVRIDPVDIMQLLGMAFSGLPSEVRLWPMSSGTLRRRLQAVLRRLGLGTDKRAAFDLASFRPRGATWMLHLTENSELVRRRGRWMSLRVMEVYLQEVVATTYLPRLEQRARDLIDTLAADFPRVLQRCSFLLASRIPFNAWFYMLADGKQALSQG